ncbi:hypothetical protein B0H17DRAFT_1183228 [Mycena rosella]|uniref:C2H2-type domain-containing protein n=1 Tax=Mycena rosella TaxID=1033263 RepID=A0AAD7G9L3_MYCRO|nr:hypothetical protein B0H17DRAFT_1183228 [Mycena rosella]
MSHPIALPAATHSQQDYNMDGGSYTGENGQFNPASYTRHFLGSPISWRAGSFGAQYCTSQSPTAMLVGSFDPVKSPQDPSILNAWNVFDRQGELCRNYTCCGTHLPDLHALLEHFEEVHIVVVDRSQPPHIQIPFNPQMNPPESAPATPQPPHHQPQYSTPFDTDDMDLGLDYSDASPPPPSTAPTSTVTSRAPSPSPSPTSSGSQRPTLNISLSGVGVGFPFREGMHTPLSAARAPAPFSAYARYNAEYNSPGGVTPQDVADYTPDSTAIAPALVFATGEELQGESPPSASASASTSPVPTTTPPSTKPPKKRSPPPTASPASATPSRVSTPTSTHAPALPSPATPAAAATTPATAGPSILLPHKPFRCPKPNCSKSYKQANGLKYHMTHGSCNYGPAKDLEAVRALLERKRATAAAAASTSSSTSTPAPEEEEEAGAGGEPSPLSQAELNEVEARVRPFACGVGDCARRYKNMNGLRYHYQHSGDHGAVGLGLLAGGVHGCLRGGANGAVGTGGAGKAQGSNAYAWGSTLLPHIQAVAGAKATTPPAAAAAAAAVPTAKTEATPFTPPTTAAHAPVTATATATPEYLAQIQRAQYAQYQQAVAAGWYAHAAPAPAPTQVDVQMG